MIKLSSLILEEYSTYEELVDMIQKDFPELEDSFIELGVLRNKLKNTSYDKKVKTADSIWESFLEELKFVMNVGNIFIKKSGLENSDASYKEYVEDIKKTFSNTKERLKKFYEMYSAEEKGDQNFLNKLHQNLMSRLKSVKEESATDSLKKVEELIYKKTIKDLKNINNKLLNKK